MNSKSLDSADSAAAFQFPTKWQWHWQTLLRLRNRLQRQTHDHLAAAGTLHQDDPDFAARASEESEFENLIAETQSEANLLAEVDAALERLRRGTYGICETTWKTIPADRLRAIPWTRFCREAAAGDKV